MRALPRLALCVFLIVALPVPSRGQAVDTAAWLADFGQLQRSLSVGYANLEWAIGARGLNLREMSDSATARLRRAGSEDQAREAIRSFLQAFGDSHLGVRWPQSGPQGAAPPSVAPAAPTLCPSLGFRAQPTRPGIAFRRLSEFRAIENGDSRYFDVGVLRVGERRFGVLRIALFNEQLFPEFCEQAATRLQVPLDRPCDGCAGMVDRGAGNLFTAALERQIAVLAAQGIDALLIDLTSNGGGSTWADPAARTLTAKPLRSPRLGFVRHPHWEAQLSTQVEDIRLDLRTAVGRSRELLQRAEAQIRRALAEAQRPCARDAAWHNQPVGCSAVAGGMLYTSGFLEYWKAGAITDADFPESRNHIYYPSRFEYREGVYSGELLVLIDQETASAAEGFAAMLRDNGAATIVGVPSRGAGCGYTNGGISTTLQHSRGRVVMPDCVRYRADGTNEVAGIEPDIGVPWRSNDSPLQRARRVLQVLSRAGARAGTTQPTTTSGLPRLPPVGGSGPDPDGQVRADRVQMPERRCNSCDSI